MRWRLSRTNSFHPHGFSTAQTVLVFSVADEVKVLEQVLG